VARHRLRPGQRREAQAALTRAPRRPAPCYGVRAVRRPAGRRALIVAPRPIGSGESTRSGFARTDTPWSAATITTGRRSDHLNGIAVIVTERVTVQNCLSSQTERQRGKMGRDEKLAREIAVVGCSFAVVAIVAIIGIHSNDNVPRQPATTAWTDTGPPASVRLPLPKHLEALDASSGPPSAPSGTRMPPSGDSSPSGTASPEPTPRVTPSPTSTATPSASPTPTPSPTVSPTVPPEDTTAPTPTPTGSSTPLPVPSPT